MSFRHLIREAAQRIAERHDRIHETYRNRSNSKEHLAAWHQATREFHEYQSPIDELMDKCHQEDIGADEALREFAIDFLECDPKFFRSGYFKEFLLAKLKGFDLRTAERQRMRSILIDAVRRRGTREYRRYCRLAAHISDGRLEASVEELTHDDDSRIRARAELMRKYIMEGRSAA